MRRTQPLSCNQQQEQLRSLDMCILDWNLASKEDRRALAPALKGNNTHTRVLCVEGARAKEQKSVRRPIGVKLWVSTQTNVGWGEWCGHILATQIVIDQFTRSISLPVWTGSGSISRTHSIDSVRPSNLLLLLSFSIDRRRQQRARNVMAARLLLIDRSNHSNQPNHSTDRHHHHHHHRQQQRHTYTRVQTKCTVRASPPRPRLPRNTRSGPWASTKRRSRRPTPDTRTWPPASTRAPRWGKSARSRCASSSSGRRRPLRASRHGSWRRSQSNTRRAGPTGKMMDWPLPPPPPPRPPLAAVAAAASSS
jgi:hypothetical protein